MADPEQKRKIIGAEFIRVFEEEARKQEGISFLAQGTIYPDIVESGPVKSHHNVGGLPEDLQFELVEPIKLLFKDEVRVVGKELGLPDNMVFRQPFPGPGLGVRCTGAITRDRLEALRESDAILREEFAKNGLEGKVWQYFTIVPDYKSTGVKDNKRSWDWHHRGDPLRAAPSHHPAHHHRGSRRESSSLRSHPETHWNDRMGVTTIKSPLNPERGFFF